MFLASLMIFCSLMGLGVRCQDAATAIDTTPFPLAPKGCASQPCLNNGKCKQIIDLSVGRSAFAAGPGYECECPRLRFEGKNCEIDKKGRSSECKKQGIVCENGGACIEQITGPVCACYFGYLGARCERRRDQCFPTPCKPMESCRRLSWPRYSCRSLRRFDGSMYQNKTEDLQCPFSPCQNGGHCFRKDGGMCNDQECADHGYCQCPTAFEGVYCENVKKTASPCIPTNPCKNFGICKAVSDQNSNPIAKCICPIRFYGEFCQFRKNETGDLLCPGSPCVNGGRCFRKGGGRLCPDQECASIGVCRCPTAFEGVYCEKVRKSVSPCIPTNPCKNFGVCKSVSDKDSNPIAKCSCPMQFYGKYCETEKIVMCTKKDCQNGGVCLRNVTFGDELDYNFNDLGDGQHQRKPLCKCPQFYTGYNCQYQVNEACATNKCKKFRTHKCINRPKWRRRGYQCKCKFGYTGKDCEKCVAFGKTEATWLTTNLALLIGAAVTIPIVNIPLIGLYAAIAVTTITGGLTISTPFLLSSISSAGSGQCDANALPDY